MHAMRIRLYCGIFQADNILRTTMSKMLTACSRVASKVIRHSTVKPTGDAPSSPSECDDNLVQSRQLLRGRDIRRQDERHVSYEEFRHGLTSAADSYEFCDKSLKESLGTTLRASRLTMEGDFYDSDSPTDNETNCSDKDNKRNETGRESFLGKISKALATRFNADDDKSQGCFDNRLETVEDFDDHRKVSCCEETSRRLKWNHLNTDACKSDVRTFNGMIAGRSDVRDHSHQDVVCSQSLTSLRPVTDKVTNTMPISCINVRPANIYIYVS